jgi:hypothetical protein
MYREAPQKKGLALNFFEILLNKDKIIVWHTAYSKDALDNYKESLQATSSTGTPSAMKIGYMLGSVAPQIQSSSQSLHLLL